MDWCVAGGTDDDVTSLLDDTVTVGRGGCDAIASGPTLAASDELVALAMFSADVRLRRSNMSDDILDELEVLAGAGIEFTDRLDSFAFALCFARRRSHISDSKHIPAYTNY